MWTRKFQCTQSFVLFSPYLSLIHIFKIFSKDNVVHPYAVIVVLTHTITQNPKVSQVHPDCRFDLESAEQHSSCVEVVEVYKRQL